MGYTFTAQNMNAMIEQMTTTPAFTKALDVAPTPVISVAPVVLPATRDQHKSREIDRCIDQSMGRVISQNTDRGINLEVRISAPTTGTNLPIILFAHGYGWSMDGYQPLAGYWAARGFIVIQPTFLDSRQLNIPADDARTPLIWRFRVSDMKHVLDNIENIIAAIPGLHSRTDYTCIAAVGHSFGSQTTGMLLGAQIFGMDEDLSDSRIKAGILICPGGRGGEDLSPLAAENYPFMNPNYNTMKAPALIISGDNDQSFLTVRGPDWFFDAYKLSPGPKSLATLYGGEHLLGGISVYYCKETTDENPGRVEAVQRLSWAYLRSALYPGDNAWKETCAALSSAMGKVEAK
jgi:dienelactone hydrolase